MQYPDAEGDDARALPLEEAMEAWGPRDLMAELRRVGWHVPIFVIDGPADPLRAQRYRVHEQLSAWFQRQVAEGCFVVSVIGGDSALSERLTLPTSWADSLAFSGNGFELIRNDRKLRDVRVRLGAPAQSSRGDVIADDPGKPTPGGWVPLSDAARVGTPEYRERKYHACVRELQDLAKASRELRTHNRKEVETLLKAIWPEMTAKQYEDVRREALQEFPVWRSQGVAKRS